MNEPSAVESAEIGAGLWTVEGDPIRFLSFPYTLRMVAATLAGGGVLVHSPVQLMPARRAFVDALGPVTHIVTPNKLHHLNLAAWAAAYPDAALFAPPGLARKRRDLRFAGTLTDEPEPAWAGRFRQCAVPGSVFMTEVVFFHVPTATLILGDLIENHDPALMAPVLRRIARVNRMLSPSPETPLNYQLSFWNRRATRAAFERILSWGPKGVVVMHGPCVFDDAETFLRHAFGWALE